MGDKDNPYRPLAIVIALAFKRPCLKYARPLEVGGLEI